MKILITLTTLLLLSGCNSTERTPEEIQAEIARKQTLLEGTLQDGTDERCYKVLSFEVFCSERNRDTAN